MQVHNKIGFHSGPVGNMTGIGDFWRKLSNAGIPIFHKGADGYGPLYEIAELVPNPHNVEHHLVYRITTNGQDDGYDYDVPPYHKTPVEAAKEHWEHTRNKLPKEFNKQKVWVEPINEIDKNRCNWLGRFAFQFANLAHAEGYKVTFFGWSSGEPEREGWETEGMLKYLRLCAERPNQAAVSVHEYDFGIDGYEKVYPHHVGRFQVLFDVCDNHGIARPTIHITEWGWALNQIPPWNVAEKHITKANQLYAKFPQIKGTAIWNLGRGPEFGNVHDQTQRLIAPLADYALNHRFEADASPTAPIDPALHKEPSGAGRQPAPPTTRETPVEPPKATRPAQPDPKSQPTAPTQPATPTVPRTTSPTVQPGVQFVADVTIPDNTPIPGGGTFTKTWRVKNTGNASWKNGYRLIHTGGFAMTEVTSQPVPILHPGQEGNVSVTMTAPTTPGSYVSDWRFYDEKGKPFGDNVYTTIIAEAAAPSPPTGTANSQFVADVNIPDNTEMAPGQSFTKTWRLRNNGTRAWGAGFTAVFAGGTAMTTDTSQPIPATAPGATADISIAMVAPATEGTYPSNWQLKDDQGNSFGDNFYVQIVVKKKQADKPPVTTRLQTGMNINPDAPNSNPVEGNALRGADWVRFVFKLAARENVAERDHIDKAFAQYDPLVRKYNNIGVKSLIVLNQETVWGNAPWTGNNDWQGFANQLANVAGQIASRYAEYGDKVGYEIWNEGDLPNNPASVYVPPEQFGPVLQRVARAIRAVSPQSPLVLGGLASGPNSGIPYLKECLQAMGGSWPVDAIGIHPYGRWATRAPFDWGQQFGTLADAFAQYAREIPGIPLWITEIGVAADNEIGPQYYAEIADYIKDVYAHIAAEHANLVPVVIWFAWSDWMRNSGIVQKDGSHKSHVYDAFQSVLKS